jgi:chromosome partitioning protein
LEVAFSLLGKGLSTLAAKGAPFCFVDTAPAITEQTAAVLSLADLVMVPVRPSTPFGTATNLSRDSWSG